MSAAQLEREALADVRISYTEALSEYPDLPQVCDRVFFDILDPLAPEDLAVMDHHARRLGIDLVVRQR